MNPAIVGAKHLLLAIITVVAGFGYLSIIQIEKNKHGTTKVALSTLLAIRDVSLIDPASDRIQPFDIENLANYSDVVTRETEAIVNAFKASVNWKSDSETYQNERSEKLYLMLKERFGDIPKGAVQQILDVSAPFSIRRECDVLVIHPSEKFDLTILSAIYFASFNQIKSEQTRFLVFDNSCMDQDLKLPTAFTFRSQTGNIFIAAEDSLLSNFEQTSFILETDLLKLDRGDLNRLVPENLKRYFPLSANYRTLDQRAVDLILVENIEKITGKAYDKKDLHQAFLDLLVQDKQNTTVFGVSVATDIFLRLTPAILLILIYLYWRTVRRLAFDRVQANELWAPLDSNDFVGLFAAYVWAIIPATAFVLVIVLYPDALQTSLVIGGKIITPLRLLTFNIHPIPRGQWVGFDWPSALTFALVALGSVLVVACTFSCLRIVKLNRNGTIIGRYHSYKYKIFKHIHRNKRTSGSPEN